jgi:1-acyl-sn-glycerol-3-phosphate acyltransferase
MNYTFNDKEINDFIDSLNISDLNIKKNIEIVHFYCCLELLKIEYIESRNYDIEKCDNQLLEKINNLTKDLILNIDTTNKFIQFYNLFKCITLFILFSPILTILCLLNPFYIYLKKDVNVNNSLISFGRKTLMRIICSWCNINVFWLNEDKLDENQSQIILFNHYSYMEPFCIITGKLTQNFIFKKSTYYIPILNILLYLCKDISIDRENLKSAIGSLHNAKKRLLEGHNVAISPEGRAGNTGLLLDFKKGPFHLALSTKKPIQPLYVYNSFELFSYFHYFSLPGNIYINVMDKIYPTDNDTVESLMYRTRKIYLKEMLSGKPNIKHNQYNNNFINYFLIPTFYIITYFILKNILDI